MEKLTRREILVALPVAGAVTAAMGQDDEPSVAEQRAAVATLCGGLVVDPSATPVVNAQADRAFSIASAARTLADYALSGNTQLNNQATKTNVIVKREATDQGVDYSNAYTFLERVRAACATFADSSTLTEEKAREAFRQGTEMVREARETLDKVEVLNKLQVLTTTVVEASEFVSAASSTDSEAVKGPSYGTVCNQVRERIVRPSRFLLVMIHLCVCVAHARLRSEDERRARLYDNLTSWPIRIEDSIASALATALAKEQKE